MTVEGIQGNNAATAEEFDRRIGDRFVLVDSGIGDPFRDFAGVVTRFRPARRVDVMDMVTSEVLEGVPIDLLRPDPQRAFKEHVFGLQFPRPRINDKNKWQKRKTKEGRSISQTR